MLNRRDLMKALGVGAGAISLGVARPGLAQSQDAKLVWGFQHEIDTLDPYATTKRSAQQVIKNVLEHLIYPDEKGDPVAHLATEWKWVDDVTLEFKLRDGVKFHNGDSFDADDVVYTIDFIKSPNNQIAFASNDYGFIDKAIKVDASTVQLKLGSPTPSAIQRLAQALYVLPKAHASMDPAEFARKPIGTGPYQVSSFEAGRRLVLTRYDGYYLPGVPHYQELDVVTIVDPQTMNAEMQAGSVDFTWAISKDQVEALQGSPNIKTLGGGSLTITFLRFDVAGRAGPGPMQDKNVRLAISHAINREALAKTLVGEASQVLKAPCHPAQFGCSQDVADIDYNPEKAKALLKASAYPNGFDLPVSTFMYLSPMVEGFIGDLRDIGINATVDARATSAILADMHAGKLQCFMLDWPSGGLYDASSSVPLFYTPGTRDYDQDPDLAKWLKEAESTGDQTERKRLYDLAIKKIMDNAYVLPLQTDVTYFAFKDTVKFNPPTDGLPLAFNIA